MPFKGGAHGTVHTAQRIGGKIMTLQEFTDRTGFYPDWALYEVTESHFSGDMDAFCKAYKENEGGLAEQIQREANNLRGWAERRYMVKTDRLTSLLNRVREDLGKTLKALSDELEWKRCDGCGTNLSEDVYDDLLELCTHMNGETDFLSEGEAKKLIAEEFGFSPDKIEIVNTACTYEANGRGELRKVTEYKRRPLYDSSIYNYIRFDVRGAAAVRHYEMIDSQLKEYRC